MVYKITINKVTRTIEADDLDIESGLLNELYINILKLQGDKEVTIGVIQIPVNASYDIIAEGIERLI